MYAILQKKIVLLVVFILITLSTLIGFSGCTTLPVETFFWEMDSKGYIQFYTNDSKFYNSIFYVWYEEFYQPEMSVVEIKLKKVSGFAWGGYGIVFCLEDEYNFYLLLIDTMGYYTVYECYEGEFLEWIWWTYSYSLKQGFNRVNTVRIEKEYNRGWFTISFNGSYEDTFYDSSLDGGYSGYFVEIWGKGQERFPNIPEDVRFRHIISNSFQFPAAGAGIDPTYGIDHVTTIDDSVPTEHEGEAKCYSLKMTDGYPCRTATTSIH